MPEPKTRDVNPVVWYSPGSRYWWMAPADALTAIQIILQYPDAIDVTNAYDVLPAEFIVTLKSRAGY